MAQKTLSALALELTAAVMDHAKKEQLVDEAKLDARRAEIQVHELQHLISARSKKRKVVA